MTTKHTTELQPRGWLITYNVGAERHTFFSGHNIISDYLAFDSKAKSEAVYTCAAELLQELQAIANADTAEWTDRTEFEAWAKSRARAAIAKVVGASA